MRTVALLLTIPLAGCGFVPPAPTEAWEARDVGADMVLKIKRNIFCETVALLEAAKHVFAASGVDAPVRMIAEKAGVEFGTGYRPFPHRSDLIVAVFRNDVDAWADAAAAREIRSDVEPVDLLLAIARLCSPDDKGGLTKQSRCMVTLLIDGLRQPPPSRPDVS